MKKIITTLVALAAISAATFADEGLKVGGFIRAGITDRTEGSVYTTNTWMNGGYFGAGTALRVNVDYTKAFGGVSVRYQATDFNDFFNSTKNVRWAMGYANFADGQIITEAGIIHDRFTTTGGWEDLGIDGTNNGSKGIRVVFAPKAVEGLYLAAQATDRFAEKYDQTDDKVKDGKAEPGEIKFNGDLFGASAKYETKAFFATAGVAIAGYYYGSFGLTAVDGLTLVGEVFHDATDATKDDNGDNAVTLVTAWAEYTGIDKVLLGAYVETTLIDGEHTTEITPAIAFDLTDLIKLSAESSIFLASYDDFDTYATITPAVTLKASEKATATVSATISTDTDIVSHSVTAGVRYNF